MTGVKSCENQFGIC